MSKESQTEEPNFFEQLIATLQELFEGFLNLFDSDAAEASEIEDAPAPTVNTSQSDTPQQEDAPETQPEPQQPDIAQPPPSLTYDREQQDTSWLDPKDYEGSITVPDSVIEDARANGKSGAYGIVTVDAGYRIGENGEKQPYARGFHVFVDIESNTTTLIPMMSGGASDIDEINFADADAVESSRNAPMPGLLHNSDDRLDGVNRIGVIETADVDDDRLGFFMLMSDGKEQRDFIGSHSDLIETEKGESAHDAPWGSRGCPMIPKSYEAQYRELLNTHGIDEGDAYYVLDHNAISAIGADMQLAGISQNDNNVTAPPPRDVQHAAAQQR